MLNQNSVRTWMEQSVWPRLKATGGETDIILVLGDAQDALIQQYPGDWPESDIAFLADLVTRYRERALIYVQTGKDPWGFFQKPTWKKIALAGGAIAAVVLALRWHQGEWLWDPYL